MQYTKLLPILAVLAAVSAPASRGSAQEPVRPQATPVAGPGLRIAPARFLDPAPGSLLIGGRPVRLTAIHLRSHSGLHTADPELGFGLEDALGPMAGSPDRTLIPPLALARNRWSLPQPRRTEPAGIAALPAQLELELAQGAGAGEEAEPTTQPEAANEEERLFELPDVVSENTELALRVDGRGELGGSWNRFRPCEPGLRLNCNPDLFPQLRPGIEFGVQVGGTISDRLHIDVDYDQRREFDAANNISVYYEGGAGELLQRVEMGDVSIGLPSSRYLTQGIPAGNFGFKAAARLGETEVEAVWAQQKGDVASREFRLGGGGQAGLVQEQMRVLDDADYVSGQFFFLVDPSRIDGSPHIDVLELVRTAAPPSVRPSGERLVLYRDEGATAARLQDQGQEGRFLANAVTEDGTLTHSGLFTLLEPGQDYYVHSSGLWIALRAPLRQDEALAVAYVTDDGTQVGDAEPEASPTGQTPELRLVRGPASIHQPGTATWRNEMHQIYRLDSSAEVEIQSLELVVSLGHVAGGATFKQAGGRQIPLLRLLGLDDDAPADRVDAAHVFRPGSDMEGLGGGAPTALRGTFIVFPTLEPFSTPPPVPSENLTASQTSVALGADANRAIYEEVDPVLRSSSARFRLNFEYRVRLEGLVSSFNLGAFGIRQGSERISVDDRLLARGVDYVIDYDLGLVTLLDPQTVLGTNPEAEIRASWEQKSLFDIAPTTVFGLNSHTRLGEYGELNLVGLYQSEQSVVRRPQLGMAPGAVLLGGASGRLAFQAPWMIRALDALPMLGVDSLARVDVTGELALSAPEPNRHGATYLDDFESTDEIPLSLNASEWMLGSAPSDPAGVPQLPWPLTPANATQMVWQDRYLQDGAEVGFKTPDQIDKQIALAGARLAERVLYMTMGREGVLEPPPQWRSITTVVSTTGRDLSRSEFLEFYADPITSNLNDAVLVIDVGAVGEDAYYFDRDGALEGRDREGRPWGRGVLDEEARLALREVWGPADDRQGLWDQSCEADRLNPVPLGDERANCTVLNGRNDSEDLDGNGVLDAGDGPMFRYVVPLDASSPYLVRGEAGTGTGFRLFRIPLRGATGTALNGATDASWRFVKHIRVTVVQRQRGRGTLALARLRIAGSRWTKRDIHGIARGMLDDLPGSGSGTTGFRVGSVSQLTDGDAYASPPGVENELQDPKSALGLGAAEFNEKSLRLSWDGLPGDERAEVFFRYPQQPRSFLEYRELRLWALARKGDWGATGDHRLLVKVGTDSRNYYLYRSPLGPPTGSRRAVPEDWRPEHVIDFATWFALKAQAEQQLVERAASGGAQGPLVVWSADSTHAVVLEDRARAPNLAAVRELSFAVHNGGAGPSDGEVWIDDLRLGGGADDVGLAGRIDVNVNAGGVLSGSLSFGGRGGRFRQLEDYASYQSSDELNASTTVELGRFLPGDWGVAMPLSVDYLRTSFDPIFLRGTDVRADRLVGLRDTETSRRRVGVSLRKTTPSDNPLLGALVDGTALRLGYVTASDGTVTTASRLSGVDGGIDYDRRVANVDLGIVPGFIASALRWLAPERLEGSEFFRRLVGARLRLTPARIGLSASYLSQDSRVWRYDRILTVDGDSAVKPIASPRRSLESSARVSFEPFQSLTGGVGLVTGRDLLEPDRATPLALERHALRSARSELAGIPLGWERDRMITTDMSFRPVIASWFRPSAAWTSRFGQRRDPSYLAVNPGPDGETAELQRTFNAEKRLTRGFIFDPALLARTAFLLDPDTPPTDAELGPAALTAVLLTRPFKPFELTWTSEVGSRFDRERVAPDAGYQLGWGGLERFRVVGEDTAVSALRRDGFRARSGVRIGGGAEVDIGYGQSYGRVLDLRAGIHDRAEQSWPDVQLSLQSLPVPEWLPALERWSVSTGYVRTERISSLRGALPRVTSEEEGTVPLELRIGFVGGLGLSYIGTLTDGTGRDPTGLTDRAGLTHGVDLSGSFTAPEAFRTRFPEPIRLSLAYDYQSQRQCRQAANRGSAAPCTPFVDHLNRRFNLTMSTPVSQIDLGVQASYVDRRSFIGTQAGSSNFQLGVFGQFNIQAGTFGMR